MRKPCGPRRQFLRMPALTSPFSSGLLLIFTLADGRGLFVKPSTKIVVITLHSWFKGSAESGGLAGVTTAGALAQSVSFTTGAIPIGPKSYTQCAKVRDLGRCGTSGRYNRFVTMREIIPLNRKAK